MSNKGQTLAYPDPAGLGPVEFHLARRKRGGLGATVAIDGFGDGSYRLYLPHPNARSSKTSEIRNEFLRGYIGGAGYIDRGLGQFWGGNYAAELIRQAYEVSADEISFLLDGVRWELAMLSHMFAPDDMVFDLNALRVAC